MIRLRNFKNDMENVEDAFSRALKRCEVEKAKAIDLETKLNLRNIKTFFKFSLSNFQKTGHLELSDLNKKLEKLERIGA